MAGTLLAVFQRLFLAAPYARDGVEIDVAGDLVSKPYLPMTAAVMAAFGVTADSTPPLAALGVRPGQRYTGRVYQIEPDASNASYFFAAAAVTGGRVRVEGLGKIDPGGPPFRRVLGRWAQRSRSRNATEVRGPRDGRLRGIEIDMNK